MAAEILKMINTDEYKFLWDNYTFGGYIKGANK